MAVLHLLRSILASAMAPSLILVAVAAVVGALKLHRVRLPWAVLSAALLALLAATATAYLFLPVLFEDVETDIACVAALAMRGLPMYPALNAAPRYILLYGPLTYLAHIPLYWIFGRNIEAFKLLGVGAFLISLLGIYRISRHYAAPKASLIGLGCAGVVFFRYIGVEFWGRIDPLILLLTVLCVWTALDAPVWAATLMHGLAVAAIPNLKISGFAYLLPVLAFLLICRGWRVTAAAIAFGALLFPLPFLLPMVSVANYARILQAAAGHGLVMNFLVRNIQYSLLLLAPVLVFLVRGGGLSTPGKLYLGCIAMGLAVTSVLGSKSGAGSYHLIPYVIPILHLYFWRRGELPAGQADGAFAPVALVWTLTTLCLATTHLRTVVREYRAAPEGRRLVAEVLSDRDLYQGRTMEVGVGADFEDRRTRYGYLTTFSGGPYTVSGAAIRDLQEGGIPIPASTVQYLQSCATAIWLIPRGDAPFSATNSYFDEPHAAFEPAFRESFLTQYQRVATGVNYDVWACRR